MSAQFWTKILNEVKDGKHGNYAKWTKSLDDDAFETHTIYYNNIWNAVLDWYDNPKTRLPRDTLSPRTNRRILHHTEKAIQNYLTTLQQEARSINKVGVAPVSNGGPGSFKVIFRPGATTQRKTFDDLRKRKLGALGNNILRRFRRDRKLTLPGQVKRNRDGSGTAYPRRAPGSIFKSGSAIERQRGLQDRLHGDLETGKRTTAAAYGGRSAVANKKDGQFRYETSSLWTTLKGTDIDDFFDARDIFREKLIDFIDMEFGFDIVQANTVEKMDDKYIMFYTQRGTAKQNKMMAEADDPQVFDTIINEGITAVRNDMRNLFNSKGFAAGIEGSPSVRERGKRAATKQVLDPLKKIKNKNVKVSSKEQKPTKARKKKTRNVKTTKAKTGRRTSSKPQRKRKGTLGVARAAGAGEQRAKGESPIALLTLLNKALPKELQKNMTGVYPKSLEYRTGRFAGSAEVTQVIPFPRMTEIQYTYQKDPYQVFEMGSGSPLASTGRDPRTIIGGTIREIAQSIMGTKYGLVRTKRM
tara:strand:+ start:45 stop:1625 length:1581 start_codon:yes stop_codon:yes gene_type:complete